LDARLLGLNQSNLLVESVDGLEDLLQVLFLLKLLLFLPKNIIHTIIFKIAELLLFTFWPINMLSMMNFVMSHDEFCDES
jgi:hypothetical protein